VALVLVSLAIQTLRPLAGVREDGGTFEPVRLSRLALAVGLTAGYLALWKPLGFQIDTVVFLMVSPMLLGFRRPIVLLAIAVATAILIAFLFHLGSGAVLPAGVLRVGWP
jgi:hypothetical protein